MFRVEGLGFVLSETLLSGDCRGGRSAFTLTGRPRRRAHLHLPDLHPLPLPLHGPPWEGKSRKAMQTPGETSPCKRSN